MDGLNVVERDSVETALTKLKKEQELKAIKLNEQKMAAKAAQEAEKKV